MPGILFQVSLKPSLVSGGAGELGQATTGNILESEGDVTYIDMREEPLPVVYVSLGLRDRDIVFLKCGKPHMDFV